MKECRFCGSNPITGVGTADSDGEEQAPPDSDSDDDAAPASTAHTSRRRGVLSGVTLPPKASVGGGRGRGSSSRGGHRNTGGPGGAGASAGKGKGKGKDRAKGRGKGRRFRKNGGGVTSMDPAALAAQLFALHTEEDADKYRGRVYNPDGRKQRRKHEAERADGLPSAGAQAAQTPIAPGQHRPTIVIDAPNVAMRYGRGKFAVAGITSAIIFYQRLGLKVVAFLPETYVNREHVGGLVRMKKLGFGVCGWLWRRVSGVGCNGCFGCLVWRHQVSASKIPDDIPSLLKLREKNLLFLTPQHVRATVELSPEAIAVHTRVATGL